MHQPLLFFDSGVGGLSILDVVRKRLPTAPIVYCADNAGYPYGARTEAELTARVPALLGRLTERHNPRLIVIACNTASVIALADVRAALDVPVVGTVPAIKPAASLTRTGVIGVLGTAVTVRQPYVDRLAAEFAADKRVLRHGARARRGGRGQTARGDAGPRRDPRSAHAAFAQDAALDTVVLACTHFPLLADELTAAAPHPVAWVDSADGIARRVAHLTQGQGWPDTPSAGTAVFTRLDESAQALGPALAERGLMQIKGL
ncbi:glutamate racemase [Hankyongella ginsenosidimutans]|uniref:Glutamate racemase n=1 Tax=Hankyongella ginsenosidimutans TaxID=1763828 RepID=A0A4D7C7P6_9SPHN|nr:aspartate/glutamate racemase family protein [Hankyongella ginsenosidimutans]QCI80130.1 glutamate racemase [Hankyongella ginsenosidimutans]